MPPEILLNIFTRLFPSAAMIDQQMQGFVEYHMVFKAGAFKAIEALHHGFTTQVGEQ
ncbi:hypothetical protein SRABI106_00202 [Rahnella aquatilis]|nr:hypothetical protein SRABI106_00202 [Rahnella aquatilis]